MVGICSQWCIDEDLTPNEMVVYLTIVRNSFGYKKRYCYLKYTDFGLSNRNTIKKTINILIEKKILFCKNTHNPKNGNRSMNEYKILEPYSYIRNFVLNGSDEPKQKIEEANWDE